MLNIKIINQIIKITIIGTMVVFICSCQKYDIESGNFFVKEKSEISSEDSLEKAKTKIYMHFAGYIADKTKRSDTNIIYHQLLNSDILTFEDYQIDSKKSFDKHTTSIKINDKKIKSKIDNFIVEFQREGKTELANRQATFRGFASIDYPDGIDLYTKSILQKDAFDRAVINIKKELTAENISNEDIEMIVANAYIVEETYGKKMYTVVVEVEL